MSLRFEAWTLPWSGSFTRVIADLPALPTSKGTVRFGTAGSAHVDLPSDYSRLDEVISDTVGSLIRVYDGSTIIHEFLAERVDHRVEEQAIARISGDDLTSAFDRAIVYPFDYPDSPTRFPNHVWGGQNVLSNPDFENNGERPTIFELWNDGAGADSFTMTDGTDTTSSIAWDASAATLETRLEADITAYDDVLVTGSGTQTDPWVIEFVTPHIWSDINLSINDTGMTSTLSVAQYGATTPTGWTKSQTVSFGTPIVHGDYDSFVISTSQAQSGTQSLFVDPATIGRRYAGAQQVLNVKPGGTYQASIWVYPTSASTQFRFVIRGIDEDFIASDSGGIGGTTYTANTWSEVTISDVTIPDDTDQIIFRFANVDTSGDPAGFYIDNASFAEGAAAATVGTIVTALMDDASTDHSGDTRGTILDWVDYTGFTASLDSNTNAWSESVSYTAHRGKTYGQVFDDLRNLGYEYTLTPKASPGATTHDLDWFNEDGAGTDHTTASSPSLNLGQSTIGGPIVKRIPKHTAVLIEGTDGAYTEDKDATAETNFGRFETYQGDSTLGDATTRGAVGDEILSAESENRTAVQLSIVRNPNHPIPLVDYNPGDTIYVQIPPQVTKQSRRIQQVAWQNSEPPVYQVTASRLFQGEAGAYEAIRKLLRRFTPLADPSLVGNGVTLAAAPTVTGAPSIAVAASDASELSKSRADYVCDGTDDHAEINAAIQDVSSTGGTVLLSEGTFNITAYIDISGSGTSLGVVLRGMGWGTVITQPSTTNLAQLVYVLNADDCVIAELAIDGNRTNQTSGGFGIRLGNASNTHIHRVKITEMESHGVTTDGTSGPGFITDCLVDGVDGDGLSIGSNEFVIADNDIRNCGSEGIFSTGTHSRIIGNRAFNCVYGLRSQANDCTIVGNVSISNSQDGLLFSGNENVVVGNVFDNNSRYGIGDASGTSNVFVANIVTNNTTAPILYGSSSGIIQHNVGDTGAGQGGGGADTDAIHDNVSAEISAVTAKSTPVDADYLLIEDSAASDAKKSTTVGDLPQRLLVGNFYQDDVAATQTSVALNLEGNNRAEAIMVRAGSVTGIAVYSNEARTAGTLTVDATVNGTATGLQAVLDATNPQTHTATQSQGTDSYSAGDRIGVKITTDGSWTPTTADITVTVEVRDD